MKNNVQCLSSLMKQCDQLLQKNCDIITSAKDKKKGMAGINNVYELKHSEA